MVKKKVYVVPHCHWDAEWYFTCEDSHILLVENMDYLLDLLEKDADFPSYTFDGLAIVLDDYLKERPENTSRIHALIRQRRLFVGPWYTQCDSLLIRTESLIRNLQYGIRTATQFGHSMNVGYLPDIFGQHAWLPAFLRTPVSISAFCKEGFIRISFVAISIFTGRHQIRNPSAPTISIMVMDQVSFCPLNLIIYSTASCLFLNS